VEGKREIESVFEPQDEGGFKGRDADLRCARAVLSIYRTIGDDLPPPARPEGRQNP
jgi:hypothetical protein